MDQIYEDISTDAAVWTVLHTDADGTEVYVYATEEDAHRGVLRRMREMFDDLDFMTSNDQADLRRAIENGRVNLACQLWREATDGAERFVIAWKRVRRTTYLEPLAQLVHEASKESA